MGRLIEDLQYTHSPDPVTDEALKAIQEYTLSVEGWNNEEGYRVTPVDVTAGGRVTAGHAALAALGALQNWIHEDDIRIAEEPSSTILSTLRPNDRNPRHISSDAVKKLCESIERDPQFMELRPIVIDENQIILGGNQRYRACVQLGKVEVPNSWVRTAAGLTDEQRKRFILIDNTPEGMSGQWDFDILKQDWDFTGLVEAGFPEWISNIFELEHMENNPNEEYVGMPSLGEGDDEVSRLVSYRKIVVHFRSAEDMKEFEDKIGFEIGADTKEAKTIWFPPHKAKRYSVEFADGTEA